MGGRGSSSNMGGYTVQDYQDAIQRRINQWLKNGTDNLSAEDKKILESFIQDRVDKSGPVQYAYGISRGISMSDSELDSLKVGGTFHEGKIASWSNKVGVAESYARGHESDSKPNKVIVRTKDPSYHAAKISDVLPGKYGLGESLMSSKAKFEITKMKIDKKNYTEIWVKPIN